ncbi:MAG: hypothetical protein ACM31H_05550, partial [Nitrososphaerales archaeon]
MKYPITLPSNGKFRNYPKVVYTDVIKNKHWRELIFSAQAGEKAVEKTLTAVLDELIDFDKTEFIKTSNKLTLADRQKIFYFHRVNSRGPEYEINFKCPQCRNELYNKFDIRQMNEKKLLLDIIEPNITIEIENENGKKEEKKLFDLCIPT